MTKFYVNYTRGERTRSDASLGVGWDKQKDEIALIDVGRKRVDFLQDRQFTPLNDADIQAYMKTSTRLVISHPGFESS